MAKRPEDVAEYIEELATELAAMARDIRLPITAYLLEMAATDARNGGQIPVGAIKRTEAAPTPH
jgi:hypothetical protein